MDARVDDFLNEINEIAPIKQKKLECVWQECYDKVSGFFYYWNTKTDEVTWVEPKDYKGYKEAEAAKKSAKSKGGSLHMPPKSPSLPGSRGDPKDYKGHKEAEAARKSPKTRSGSLYMPPKTPTLPGPRGDPVKIYKVLDNTRKTKHAPEKYGSSQSKTNVSSSKGSTTKNFKHSSDSEDEKIVLISSYGGDTESEDEENEVKKPKAASPTKPPPPCERQKSYTEDDDNYVEEDILSKIQKRAQELKALGGKLPPGVEQIVEKPQIPTTSTNKVNPVVSKTKKDISGFSLVAGYGDSDDEQENNELKSLFPIAPVAPVPVPEKISHSTLFPITKPIDIKDFATPQVQIAPEITTASTDFGTKIFQRKRRIGIDLVNTKKRPKPEVSKDVEESEHKGFGFNSGSSIYPGFKSGGVMFVKSDVLNPSVSKTENDQNSVQDVKNEEVSNVEKQDVENTYTTLKEKLTFLCEGRAPILPVQEMIIQAQTLFTAMMEGGLKLIYLHKWLTETNTELIKLEKEAAPEGWLLQWDRSHKRYYYQNQYTGEGQWQYPQPDVVRCDEAMDISTTPPPPCPIEQGDLSPPLPPEIRSPSPPPPPIISRCDEDNFMIVPPAPPPIINVPFPPPPPPRESSSNEQPLPPGVDQTEETFTEIKEQESNTNLSSALDSFYSDLAAIESTNSPNPDETTATIEGSTMPAMVYVPDNVVTEPVKKKKKKIKLAEGLAMKKKGVSKLVEKWKNVQMSYN